MSLLGKAYADKVVRGKIGYGGVNTHNATAGPEDIRAGETAYVKGRRIIGTLSDPKLEDVIVAAGMNGEVVVKPSEGYDALSSVTVKVNVKIDPDKYTIINNLTNCTTNNNATSVEKEGSYSCTITPNAGYALKSLRIVMGSEIVKDVTYDPSPISTGWTAYSVTGNIVITAVAEESTEANIIDDVLVVTGAGSAHIENNVLYIE